MNLARPYEWPLHHLRWADVWDVQLGDSGRLHTSMAEFAASTGLVAWVFGMVLGLVKETGLIFWM